MDNKKHGNLGYQSRNRALQSTNHRMKIDSCTVELSVGIKVLNSAGVTKPWHSRFNTLRIVVGARCTVIVQPVGHPGSNKGSLLGSQ